MENKDNSKNTFLAIALSIMVLMIWQVFYAEPLVEQERNAAQVTEQREALQSGEAQPTGSELIPQSNTGEVAQSQEAPRSFGNRDEALAADVRIPLETDLLIGSINLKGARIDDLKLKNYRVENSPESPFVTLLSPRGSQNAYFAEFGYTPSENAGSVPGPDTVWTTNGNALSADSSITLTWTNEKGLRFNREIALDDQYMFTVKDTVSNSSGEAIAVTPYGRIARFEKPPTENIFVLHEGLIGVIGEQDGLQEYDYNEMEDAKEVSFPRVDKGWLGITDKYWGTALIPSGSFKPRFFHTDRGQPLFQTDYLGSASEIPAGGTVEITQRLFAGAKKTVMVDGYQESLGIYNFELMIDWGWFYFITKPLFYLLNWLFGIVNNFGVAILIATVIIKLIFLYFANLSYASMAKMKKVQPEMMEIRERFSDDKQAQQKAIMELYKKEKINPAAGCLPILIQIPVFFALYKVLYVTIEMRHAPFFGWIQDLAAPDPSSIWNLFGLLPWEPSLYLFPYLLLGVWPLLMGITMFVQMQMNPAPPDPTQAMIFRWMPVVFTFMLSIFPAGLVIYWAWNNFLSIIQQGFIMKRHGAKIELMDNLKSMFSFGKKSES